jgi:hypothetical protein
VQAGVDPRSCSGGGEHITVINVEDSAVHRDIGVAFTERVECVPMGDGRASGEESAVGEGEGPETKPDDGGTLPMRLLQRTGQLHRRALSVLAPGRNDHNVGSGRGVEAG